MIAKILSLLSALAGLGSKLASIFSTAKERKAGRDEVKAANAERALEHEREGNGIDLSVERMSDADVERQLRNEFGRE